MPSSTATLYWVSLTFSNSTLHVNIGFVNVFLWEDENVNVVVGVGFSCPYVTTNSGNAALTFANWACEATETWHFPLTIALFVLFPFSSRPFSLINLVTVSSVVRFQSTPSRRTRSSFGSSSAKHLSMTDKTLALLVFSQRIVDRFCTPASTNPALVNSDWFRTVRFVIVSGRWSNVKLPPSGNTTAVVPVPSAHTSRMLVHLLISIACFKFGQLRISSFLSRLLAPTDKTSMLVFWYPSTPEPIISSTSLVILATSTVPG